MPSVTRALVWGEKNARKIRWTIEIRWTRENLNEIVANLLDRSKPFFKRLFLKNSRTDFSPLNSGKEKGRKKMSRSCNKKPTQEKGANGRRRKVSFCYFLFSRLHFFSSRFFYSIFFNSTYYRSISIVPFSIT